MKLLEAGKLVSRSIRRATVAGKSGGAVQSYAGGNAKRKIGSMFALDTLKNDNTVVGWLWNQASRFTGFLFSNVGKFLQFSLVGITQWLFSTAQKLFIFDWNVSDKAIADALKSQQVSLASIWGNVFGAGVGYLGGIAVGAAVSFAVPVIGGAGLAALVSGKVAAEALEEIGSLLRFAILQTVSTAIDRTALISFQKVRSLIKGADQGFLNQIFGAETGKWLKEKWGAEGGPNYSLEEIGDQAISRIKSPELKAFISNATDEAWDTFMESGFITAHTIDEQIAIAKKEKAQQLGPQRSFQLQLDSSNPAENLNILSMPEQIAIPTVQNIIANHRIMAGKDVGIIAAQSIEEAVKLGPQLRKLTITYNSNSKPPFSRKGKAGTRATISIPDVKAGVQWPDVKATAKKYVRGNTRVECTMDNGRSMSGYFLNEAHGKEILRELAQMSTTDINELSWRVSTGEKTAGTFKGNESMYPVNVALIFPRRDNLKNKGPLGKSKALPLWQDTEPAEKLQETAKKP